MNKLGLKPQNMRHIMKPIDSADESEDGARNFDSTYVKM